MSNVWYQSKLKVNTEYLSPKKSIKWYDLLECYYTKEGVRFLVYLPASFLKIHGILPNSVDIGDDNQYLFDFEALEIDGLTLSQYVNGCEKNKQLIDFDILMKYCKCLYREEFTFYDYIEENGQCKKRIQPNNILKREFDEFYELFTGKNFNIPKDMYDWVKLFILFRSIKIGGLPINYKEQLSSEKNLFRLQYFFKLDKDNATIAFLDGIFDDDRSRYIKQWYALLWCNSNFNNDEIVFLLDCMNMIEYHMNMLIYHDIDAIFEEIRNNSIIKTDDKTFIIDNDTFMNTFIVKFKYLVRIKEKELIKFYLKNCLASKKLISSFSYCILNVYIINKMKQLMWKNIVNTALEDAVKTNLSKEELNIVKNITSKYRIECLKEKDLLNVLFSLPKEQLKILLDFIYPNDKRKNIEKKREIKRIFPAIFKVYKHYLRKKGLDFSDIGYNHLYNLLIFLWLFYNIKSEKNNNIFNIRGLKYTDSGLNRKNINDLQLVTLASYIKKDETPVALEMLTDIFIRYEFLLDLNGLYNNTLIYSKNFNKVSAEIQVLLYDYLYVTKSHINKIYVRLMEIINQKV